MFELYYIEKLRELEVERLRRMPLHRAGLIAASSFGDLLTGMKALTIQRVVTALAPQRPR